MAISLNIIGALSMTIKDISGIPVNKKTQSEILNHLECGQYVIGIESRTIKDLDALDEDLYIFDLDVDTQDIGEVEYEFDNI